MESGRLVSSLSNDVQKQYNNHNLSVGVLLLSSWLYPNIKLVMFNCLHPFKARDDDDDDDICGSKKEIGLKSRLFVW